MTEAKNTFKIIPSIKSKPIFNDLNHAPHDHKGKHICQVLLYPIILPCQDLFFAYPDFKKKPSNHYYDDQIL